MAPDIPVLQSIVLGAILMVLGYVLIGFIPDASQSDLRKLFMQAFAVRIAAVYLVFFYLLGVGGDGFSFSDDRDYHIAGWQIALANAAGNSGYEMFSHEQNVGYFYFVGWLYSLVGADTLSARVINGFLSALSVVFLVEVARTVFGPRTARISGLLFAFMPNIVYWSVLQFKDASLIFLTVFTLYMLLVRLRAGITLPRTTLLVAGLVLLWFIRKDLCLPLIGVVVVWIAMRQMHIDLGMIAARGSGVNVLASAALFVMAILSFAVIANTSAGETFIERYDRISERSFSSGGVPEAARGVSRVGFSRYLRMNHWSEVYKAPPAMAFTLVAPLPNFGTLTNQQLAGFGLYSLSNLAFLFLLPYVIVGFVASRDMSAADSLVLRWFPFAVLMGISVIFLGVLRYKEQLMPYLVMLAGYAISQRHRYQGWVTLIYGVGILSIFALIGLLYFT